MINNYNNTIETIINELKTNYELLKIPFENINIAGKKGADLNISTPFLYVYPIPNEKKGIYSPIITFDIVFVIGISSITSTDCFSEVYQLANYLNGIVINYLPFLTPTNIPLDIIENNSDIFIVSVTYQTDILFYDNI